MLRRHKGKWSHCSTNSWSWHKIKVNGQLQKLATQPLEKEDLLLLSQKDGWAPHWPGRAGEKKNCYPRRGPKPNSLFLQPQRLHYTTLHYTTSHHTTLHDTTQRHTTLNHNTPHYTTRDHTTPHYATLRHATLHYTTLQRTTTTLHHTTLHYSTLHYTTIRYTTAHYTTLHHTTLRYKDTTLHYRANNVLSYLNTAFLHTNVWQTAEWQDTLHRNGYYSQYEYLVSQYCDVRHTPCPLKLCIPPSSGIVRWWLFPVFGAELPLDNCTSTVILNNPVLLFCNITSRVSKYYFYFELKL